ncbi:MAG: putative SAM-dependent methyltransferase [Micavibrio sp.]|nr:putative SAM-dependent methyltransferase [Micavibrio sp.]
MDLKEEDILGDKIGSHWYYVSKGRALTRFLGTLRTKNLLDVGAGSGIFSRQLLDQGIAERAVCVDPNYAEEKAETHNGKEIAFVRQDKGPYNLVLMMDVLEHVPDDVALLKEYGDQMPKGGHVLITVPAFQFLWSGHDVFLEHYRRYTAKMVEDIVKAAGLEVVKTRYFFGLLFPLVCAIRFVKTKLLNQGKIEAHSELKLYPDAVNCALIAAHDIERWTIFDFNKVAGLSVFCLCKKP